MIHYSKLLLLIQRRSRRLLCHGWKFAMTAGLTISGIPSFASGQVFLTQEEALELAFPEPASIQRVTVFLDDGQLQTARRLAGRDVPLDQRVVTYYAGREDGQLLGIAYFDAHRVRTMREVVMVVISPEGTVDGVEVLSFLEPPEYQASEPWIEQLIGRTLSEDLAVNRGVINLTGATLTAGALTRAVRRVLALHQVVRFPEAVSGR